MSNKQYSSQYRDNQFTFLLLDLLPYPFPSSPFKVWVYLGRGNLLGSWDSNMQWWWIHILGWDLKCKEEKLRGKFWWGSLEWRIFWESKKKTKKASKGWQPEGVLKPSQYSQICSVLYFKIVNGKISKLFHYPGYQFKPDKYQWNIWIQNNAGNRADPEVKKMQNFTTLWVSAVEGDGRAVLRAVEKQMWCSCLCQDKGPWPLLLARRVSKSF